jgi:hypothetical protein
MSKSEMLVAQLIAIVKMSERGQLDKTDLTIKQAREQLLDHIKQLKGV